jgi:hypothetical protein
MSKAHLLVLGTIIAIAGCMSSKHYLGKAYEYQNKIEELKSRNASKAVLLGYYKKMNSEILIALDKDPKYKEAYDLYFSSIITISTVYDTANKENYFNEALPYAKAYKLYYPNDLEANYFFTIIMDGTLDKTDAEKDELVKSGEFFITNSTDDLKKEEIRKIISKYIAGAE